MEPPAIIVFSLDTEPYYNISSNESVIQKKQTTPPNSTHYSAAQYWHQETPQCVGSPQTHRIIKSFVCSIILDFISLTEGSVLDPCYKILD